MGSSTTRTIIGIVAVFLILGVLRYKPWQHTAKAPAVGGSVPAGGGAGEERQQLAVGFLPVT